MFASDKNDRFVWTTPLLHTIHIESFEFISLLYWYWQLFGICLSTTTGWFFIIDCGTRIQAQSVSTSQTGSVLDAIDIAYSVFRCHDVGGWINVRHRPADRLFEQSLQKCCVKRRNFVFTISFNASEKLSGIAGRSS